ncbi:hypothetical protein TWF694_003150 [Orbilia ellipsospora]|uniref:Nephrocystin 3-like N-terminal domain-containing protein n=1 Tax=Orbilia ellipsospora TaxID=2528407 RepID=A0AAV9X396_9PEZI
MDPLTALGTCSSILQIIDFSCKILSKGNQLRKSVSGTLTEHLQIETINDHLIGLVAPLKQQSNTITGPQAQKLNELTRLSLQMADELSVVLNDLKALGPRTRWKTLRAAVKSVWKKEKVEEMLKRLVAIRDELEFGILLALREDLIQIAQEHSNHLRNLDQSTRAIFQAVLNGQSITETVAQTQLHAIRDMHSNLGAYISSELERIRNEILDELRQQGKQTPATLTSGYGRLGLGTSHIKHNQLATNMDIILTLKFLAIGDRYSAIPEAYNQTFEWIWQQQYGSPGWSSFWSWLTKGVGIYWISGKAGSGKSTLMKYIHQNSRTSGALKQWSADNDVIIATFFFSKSGSAMEKSQLGLLQSILYEVLSQKPDLKEIIFPENIQEDVFERWKSRHAGLETIWSIRDLRDAFTRLLEVPFLKVCLFIDGLDEYDGDYEDVIDLLNIIITSPCVKACVSSRALLIFERTFSSSPGLKLQDLTYNDINLYIKGKLEGRAKMLEMGLAHPEEFQ